MKNTIATIDEVKTFKAVEKAIEFMNEEQFCEFIDKVSDMVFSMGNERKTAYNKLRTTAKKLGVKVLDLETWYYIEVAN